MLQLESLDHSKKDNYEVNSIRFTVYIPDENYREATGHTKYLFSLFYLN